MCGIIGYLGGNEAAPILVEALRRLEYRGYDSSGIATLFNGRIQRRRAVGRLSSLSDLLVRDPIRGTTGIGHTRWATHGPATVQNAHPHSTDSVCVVHNGIIENYRTLRDSLRETGYEFSTETDTESVSVLCQSFIDQGMAPVEAARATLRKLQGQFALCFLFSGESDLIFVARRGSPLAVGHSRNAMYVASDALGLAGLSSRITYLDEGDSACVTKSGAKVFDADNRPVKRKSTLVAVSTKELDKNGYKHFMEKEIFEQPKRLATAIDHVKNDGGLLDPELDLPDFSKVGSVKLIGCGTASYACKTACYWFEKLARIPASYDVASEFRYRSPVIQESQLTVLVSQSGETADTLAALNQVLHCKGKNLSILNNMTSSMARESSYALPINAGMEIGVASTKAFTCQLLILFALAIRAGMQKGVFSKREQDSIIKKAEKLPGLVNAVLAMSDTIRSVAQELSVHSNALFIGRGSMYPTAMEGALKLKEISYIHAEGLASGELKHGPIALIERTFPTIVLAPSGELFEKTVSNLEEIRARNGPIVLFTDLLGINSIANSLKGAIVLPTVDPLLAPILYAVPLQLLAYHTAVIKGTDVDKPRNLAKSVTVE